MVPYDSKGLRLLREVLGEDTIIKVIRDMNTKEAARVLLNKLYLTNLFPPLRDLLPALATVIFEPLNARVNFLEDFIARKGLLSRIWIRDQKSEERFVRNLRLVQGLSTNEFLRVFISLIGDGASAKNWNLRHRFLIDALFVLNAYTRRLLSQKPELIPSPNLASRIDKYRKSELSPNETLSAIVRTIYVAWPKYVLEDIDFALRLSKGAHLHNLSADLLLEFVSGDSPELIKILNLVTFLYMNPPATRYIGERVRLNLIKFLLRKYLMERTEEIYGWITSFRMATNLDRIDLLNLLTIYRLATIHGGRVALRLLEKLYEDIETTAPLAILLLIFAGYHGRELDTIISSAIRRNKIGLRLINEALIGSGLKPHGIAVPIPWELYGPVDKLLRNSKLAIKYYKSSHTAPPRRLLQLTTLLRKIHNVLSLKSRDISDLKELKKTLELLLETISQGHEFVSDIRRSYGVLPGFFRIINDVLKIHKKHSDRWSYLLLRNYLNFVTRNPQLFVTSALSTDIDMQTPTIFLVVDGLRYDDLTLRLLPKLRKQGFKIIRRESKISLLPSITMISRRGIISGAFPELLILSTRNLRREDEILTSRFGSNIEIYYGPIAVIYNKFTAKEKHPNRIIVVLSELEKSMHGASESVLAHFVDEYLDNMMELIMHLTITLTRKNRKVRVVICSDHGLGVFPKFYDLSIFIDKLAERRLIDRSLEPLIKERFAAIPFQGPQQLVTAQQIYNSDDEFRTSFWVVSAESLGFREVEFYSKGTKLITKIRPGSQVAIIFAKGPRKFVRGRGTIYHGGVSPEETLSSYAVLEYEI